MKVIYFGTPAFAAETLTYLLENGIHIVAVVSKPDKPKGRSGSLVPTPVKLAAQAFDASLPIYQPEIVSCIEFEEILRKHQADFFVVVAYGEIIKQQLLDLPKKACINLHGSILPKYRGAAPIQRSIINGEKETGITIMHMVRKMDAGDMIKKEITPITPEMTFGELETVLCTLGKKALLDVLQNFDVYDQKKEPQKTEEVTFAPKIELEDCQVAWDQPAQSIHDLVRGVNPFPGAWTHVFIKGEKKLLKILKTRVVNHSHETPGLILNPQTPKENLIIACGDQALELVEIQLEGKKKMNSAEWTRGVSRQNLSFLPPFSVPG